MLKKEKLKLLAKLLETVYSFGPNVGCNDYILDGQYSYDQVIKLNKITGYSAGFGYCKELGPIAFIGVPNPECVQNSGYFFYDVQEYGDSFKREKYYFEQLNDKTAKLISNYTVYGMGDPRIFKNIVPIKKLDLYQDYRYKRKCEFNDCFISDVLDMDIKLGGTYSFYEARQFAYGSTEEFKGASGEDVPIQFAIVGNNEPVGILGLWKHYNNSMFRDVWGSNEDEPKEKPIRFLKDEEASKIDNFKLYYFTPTHSYGEKQYIVEKKDRMFDKDFNFTMSDGTDYRLLNHPIYKEKVKTLK